MVLFSLCLEYTRKVEALGGHLFVPGQVGDADIKKRTKPFSPPWPNGPMVIISDESHAYYYHFLHGN